MNEIEWLAARFAENRARLRTVAYRMLGSTSEADDAVQEAWLKLNRSDRSEIQNLGGWLTTVVARVCLDMLRARRSRREEPLSGAAHPPDAARLEDDLALADATGPALLVVLEMLAPAERVAFVLHDLFDLSFEEIAPIVNRTAEAARQLASRARRRVRGAAAPAPDIARQRELVGAFLAASREGDFDRLLAVLSPEVVLHADGPAVRAAAARREHGAPELAAEIRGAAQVANAFKGRATGAQPALIDGMPGAVWAVGGQVRAAFVFSTQGSAITSIDLITEPARLTEFEISVE
jgi:RNA polymerase sigma-70 factor (ECF subfamily)